MDMRDVLTRIAIWASAGFLVSVGWGFYFANANRDEPIGPIIYGLAGLTQPFVAVAVRYGNFPIGLRTAVAANAATYALIGLIIGTIRRYSR